MHDAVRRIAVRLFWPVLGLWPLVVADCATGQTPGPADVNGQPLAANVERVVRALDMVGAPLPAESTAALAKAGAVRDAIALQKLLDPYVLLVVTINPRSASRSGAGRPWRRFSKAVTPRSW